MGITIFNYIKDNGFKTSKIEEANFQFMPGGVDNPWKLKVPKDRIPEFLEKYYDYKVKPHNASHLLERPMKDKNVLKIDIDLRYTANPEDMSTDKLEHKYHKNTIKDFIHIYLEIAAKYIKFKDNTIVTVMEKKQPKFDATNSIYIKDGLHIMCPDIVAPNSVLMAIYNEFIENEEAIKVFDDFKNTEPIVKGVDSRVIFTNSWYLLGSGKPQDKKDYYKPTKSYKVYLQNNKVKLKPVKLEMTELEMIVYFSNYNKDVCNELLDAVNVEQLQDDLKINGNRVSNLTNYEKAKFLENIPKIHKNKKPVDIKYIFRLLKCLNQSRVEKYELWFNVACCLYSISPYNYEIFQAWSKTANDKYSEDGCFLIWYETLPKHIGKYSNLNLDMLKYYAQKDNELEYQRLFESKRTEFFDNMITGLIKNKLDKSIANILFVKYVKEYIELHCEFSLKCADITKNIWYIFKHNRWLKDEGGNEVYKLFTRDFVDNFTKKYTEYEQAERRARARLQNKTFLDSLQNNNTIPQNLNMDELLMDSRTDSPAPSETTRDMNIVNNDDETLIETIEKNKRSITNLCEFINKPANRNNIIKDLSHECYDADFYRYLDTNPDVFICNNCVLDLKDCIIRNGQPGDMNSIYCGIDFPMNVTNEHAEECFDELEEFFDKLFPDLDVRDYILNYYAESLSGKHRREEFGIHTGCGRNGKSVFSCLLSLTFGNYYYEPDATIYSNYNADPNSPSPVIANIKGKRLVMTQETKNNKPLESVVIKKMSGGDALTGRHLSKDPITFKPQCKFNMSCNDIPDLDANDFGTFRRILVFPYVSTFCFVNDKRLKNPNKFKYHYECDLSIESENKLEKWAPYFLYMLWQRYIDLHSKNFEPLNETNRPDAIQQATEEYKKQSNMYSNFIREQCEFNTDKKQPFKEIFAEFKIYAIGADKSFKFKRNVCEKNLERDILSLGAEKHVDNGELYIYYVCLKGQGVPL